jgi:hypothetical protein
MIFVENLAKPAANYSAPQAAKPGPEPISHISEK